MSPQQHWQAIDLRDPLMSEEVLNQMMTFAVLMPRNTFNPYQTVNVSKDVKSKLSFYMNNLKQQMTFEHRQSNFGEAFDRFLLMLNNIPTNKQTQLRDIKPINDFCSKQQLSLPQSTALCALLHQHPMILSENSDMLFKIGMNNLQLEKLHKTLRHGLVKIDDNTMQRICNIVIE